MSPPADTPDRMPAEGALAALVPACREVYGERLVTVAVFGSTGRGTARPDSDIDVLLVADPLPLGRMRRVAEFEAVETRLRALVKQELGPGPLPPLSPVLKTPEEVRAGSPLFLDMTEDARLLFDRDGFFQGELRRLRARLAELKARRIWVGSAWYWDLKPDYRPGEVFEL